MTKIIEIIRTVIGEKEVIYENIQPTLEAISRKLARVNGEIELIMERMAEEQTPSVDLSPVLEKLDEQLGSEVPAGEMLLRYACERDDNGNTLAPTVIPVPAAPNQLTGLLWRLNALAALVDAQRLRRVRTCRDPATGDPVTVTFEEVI